MMRIVLTSIVLLAMGDATVNAAPMVKAGTKAEETSKPKKRRGFKSMMAKSIGFVASSAVHGGMSDR
jgi:hypothetical protein